MDGNCSSISPVSFFLFSSWLRALRNFFSFWNRWWMSPSSRHFWSARGPSHLIDDAESGCRDQRATILCTKEMTQRESVCVIFFYLSRNGGEGKGVDFVVCCCWLAKWLLTKLSVESLLGDNIFLLFLSAAAAYLFFLSKETDQEMTSSPGRLRPGETDDWHPNFAQSIATSRRREEN